MEERTLWADPSPAALFANGVALAGLGAVLAGLVPAVSAILLVPWLMGITFVLIVCSIIMYRNGDLYGGTVNLLIGAVLLGSGNWLSLLCRFAGWPLGAPIIGTLCQQQISQVIEGYFFIPLIIFLIVIAIIGGRASWLITTMVGVLALAVVSLSVWLLSDTPGIADSIDNVWANTCGWMLFAGSLCNIYLATAGLVDRMAHRMILPIGRPLFVSDVRKPSTFYYGGADSSSHSSPQRHPGDDCQCQDNE